MLSINGLGEVKECEIDSACTFYVTTHNNTGSNKDADSVPSYRIYEEETGTALTTGTMTLLDAANTNGFYSESFTPATAAGYEASKQYGLYICATVDSITGCTAKELYIVAAGHSVEDGNINLDDVETDTAAQDTSTELRTLLVGSDTALSTLTASDNIGVNWADISNPTTALDLSGTVTKTVDTCSALTANNDKTGYTLSGFTASWVDSECTDATELAAERDLIKTNTSKEADRIIIQGNSAWATSSLSAANVWDLDISGYSGAKAGYYIKELYDNQTRLVTADISTLQTEADASTRYTNLLGNQTTLYTEINEVTDEVWDESQAGYTSAGTFGYYLDYRVSAVPASGLSTEQNATLYSIMSNQTTIFNKIRDTYDYLTNGSAAGDVWEELTSGHTTTGTFGKLIQNILRRCRHVSLSGRY